MTTLNWRILSIGTASLALLSGLLATNLYEAVAAETILIQADSTAAYVQHVGGGFHGGFKDTLPGALFTDLKPAALRSRFTIASEDSEWTHINEVGGVAIMALPYSIVASTECPSCEFPCATCTAYGDTSPMNHCYVMPGQECWEDYVGAVVDTVQRVRGRYPELEIHYDIWNEPDLPMFWNAPGFENDALFYAVWDSTVTFIRDRDPSCTITGPSFAHALRGKNSFDMDEFLSGRKQAGTLPDVLGWHSAGSENSLGNVYQQVESAIALLDDLEITSISRFEVNEALSAYNYKTSGAIVRLFATAERAAPLGLESASTAYHAGWDGGFLSGSITQAGERRYAWFVRKAYADMKGLLVHVDEAESLDGLGTWNPADTTLTILLGANDSGSADTVTVRVKGLEDLPGLVANDVVNVLVEHYPGGTADTMAVAGPAEVFDERRLVTGDSVEIKLTGIGGYDALGITLSAIDPGTTPAPGKP